MKFVDDDDDDDDEFGNTSLTQLGTFRKILVTILTAYKICTVIDIYPPRIKMEQDLDQRKSGKGLEKELWTVGFSYSWKKIEMAACDGAGWKQVVCGLCTTGSDKA